MSGRRKLWAVVGYHYGADLVCPACIATMFGGEGEDAEDVLERVAAERGIARSVEESFDSSEFPKAVLVGDLQDGDACAECGEPLDD